MRAGSITRAAVAVALLVLTFPPIAEARSLAEREPYRAERARHDQIRVRAEKLSKHPRLSRYDLKAAEARIADDREMKRFELRAKAPGGQAATPPALKLYNDSLDVTLQKMLTYVRR